jgi:hypothetical protein
MTTWESLSSRERRRLRGPPSFGRHDDDDELDEILRTTAEALHSLTPREKVNGFCQDCKRTVDDLHSHVDEHLDNERRRAGWSD